MAEKDIKIDKFYLEDGRMAERHTFTNDTGDEVIEQFVEPERNMSLNKRVTTKKKEIVAEQKIETIKDGEVVDVLVNSVEPNVKLELREHIKTEPHASSGDYATKQDISRLVSDAVIAGITPVIQSLSVQKPPKEASKPLFRTQSVVENNISEKKKYNMSTIAIFALVATGQLAVLCYLFW